ncbi:MAG TPA: exopolysaccharide biosynthesis protein [Chiayiivirga sp.]|nr:exopolysaccharide biosynthesis protein [Chiayiivirga sp.]
MNPSENTHLSTSALLKVLVNHGEGETIAMVAVLNRFRRRAFGVLLMLVLLPAFIPLPTGAGVVSGPLVSLLGLQMLLGRRMPWLPRRALRYRIKRSTLERFAHRLERVLRPLERACKPRLVAFMRHRPTLSFTGLLLIALGILLALPIPLTNYPFGILLMLFAVAIIERDGGLQIVAWLLGCGAIVASALLSNEVIALLRDMAA